MKKMIRLMTCAVVAAMSMEAARATLNGPSNGSDGHLVVTNNLVIDLSQAITAPWDSINTGANIGLGRYDSGKWAVVFHYESVTIQGGATVTFKNHDSRAPVVWLVQGDVTINGTVSLDGQGSQPASWLAVPGPGGGRSGSGYYAPGAGASPGFGPGAGRYPNDVYGWATGGSYGSVGWNGGAIYGNPSLIPLIGGSGGGGGPVNGINSGGAGGGAMLIASARTLTISGSIHANGGSTYSASTEAAAGSGGGLRLVAESLVGSGLIQTLGGVGPSWNNGSQYGGLGRIRIERSTNTFNGTIAPTGPSVEELSPGATPVIWLPTNGPTVRIVSIGGKSAPADPRAEFGAFGADVVLPQITNVTVVVETTVAESDSTVSVRATPRSNGNFSERIASLTQVVSEDPKVIRWTANVPVSDGYAAIQVKVVRP